jgi:hypothetical protein
MLNNQPWIDPRDVDWTSGFNGLRVPGWNRNNNPYVWQALKDVFLQALANGKGIEPRIYVCPDPPNQLIQVGQTYDFEVPSEPNLWLWAINASGRPLTDDDDARLDFLFNVTDSTTGATLFSTPALMSLFNEAGTGTNGRGVQSLMSSPHLFASPSYPVVRVINNSDTPQTCRVTLFCCVEYDL